LDGVIAYILLLIGLNEAKLGSFNMQVNQL